MDKLSIEPDEDLPRLEVIINLSVAYGAMNISLPCIENVFIYGGEAKSFQSLFSAFGATLDKIVKNPAAFEADRVEEYKEYT